MAERGRGGEVVHEAQFGDERLRGRSRRRVLLVGDVPGPVLVSLDQRGAQVRRVASLAGAFDVLLAEAFDVVVVNPHCDLCGRDLVAALKESNDAHLHTVATVYGSPGQAAFLRRVRPPTLEQLVELRARYQWTPFIVLPLAGEDDYAVVVRPPKGTELRNANESPSRRR